MVGWICYQPHTQSLKIKEENMKLGGSVIGAWQTPEQWQALLQSSRFKAITSPVDSRTDRALASEILQATREMGVAVAEAGVWKNVLAPDQKEREAALRYARDQLAFAEEHGIPCCVNVAGSRGQRWDGAYKDNYSQETYDLIVGSVRDIIDSVQPKKACYSLEPMPWMMPDGPDEYLQMIEDIGRAQFKVHMDFVNMINSPRRFLFAHEFIEECLQKLGKEVISLHLKDSRLDQPFTSLIHEAAPGKGSLDFRLILKSIDRHLPKDIPVLLEHMSSFEEYADAYDYVAQAAREVAVPIT
jgi:sugar phosphate isomerase/epimerase